MGFSGFYRRVFDGRTLTHIRLGEISRYGEKRELGESEILKILIRTKTRNLPP